jgi:3-deoxy-D-manno-octulosonate 8-phosphate phosphatase (KDO 8-P phosphatase)
MIKIFVTDVDGTLTDGKIYFGEKGEVFKVFHIRDGFGMKELLAERSIVPVVITGRQSEMVASRMRELKIRHVYQGVSNKYEFLAGLIQKLDVPFSDVAYIGDDLNDLECIHACGFTACPSDAVAGVKAAVDYVCKSKGGEGAVREFIEEMIRSER